MGVIDFPQPAIGRQQYAIELTPQRFVEDIAPARTFGFRDQIEQLRAAGLIQGGGLENALVCDGDHWLNPPLRYPEEPVRHKLLDLIGDLALVGFPQAQVLIYRGSLVHTDLAAALADRSLFNSTIRLPLHHRRHCCGNTETLLNAGRSWGCCRIAIPSLVDRVIEHVPGEKAVALKNVTRTSRSSGPFPRTPFDARADR